MTEKKKSSSSSMCNYYQNRIEKSGAQFSYSNKSLVVTKRRKREIVDRVVVVLLVVVSLMSACLFEQSQWISKYLNISYLSLPLHTTRHTLDRSDKKQIAIKCKSGLIEMSRRKNKDRIYP